MAKEFGIGMVSVNYFKIHGEQPVSSPGVWNRAGMASSKMSAGCRRTTTVTTATSLGTRFVQPPDYPLG